MQIIIINILTEVISPKYWQYFKALPDNGKFTPSEACQKFCKEFNKSQCTFYAFWQKVKNKKELLKKHPDDTYSRQL